MNYKICSVEELNLGYDLVATKKVSTVICIEVKGRCSPNVSADFSVNEYNQIKKVQNGIFRQGEYKICIVTDTQALSALKESKGDSQGGWNLIQDSDW